MTSIYLFSVRIKDINVDDEEFSEVTMKSEALVPVPAPGIIEVNFRHNNYYYNSYIYFRIYRNQDEPSVSNLCSA